MIMSMTGFASTTLVLTGSDGTQTKLSIMLKSLNARFFEFNCKLPYALTHLETEFLKTFKKALRRGNIFFNVQVSNPALFKGSVQADLSVAQGYLDACTKLQKAFSIPGTITINDLLNLSTIFSAEERTIDETTKKLIGEAVHDVLEKLIETRKSEGQALLKDLQERTKAITEHMNLIELRAQEIMQQSKQEILERLENLDETSPLIDQQRATLYAELDRIDIHEEIVRFSDHLASFEKTLVSQEIEKGRRLDFILQELGREINTIAAKCNDTQISRQAINIKVELEKAREQAQNIV